MIHTHRWLYLLPLLSSFCFIGLSWLLYQQAELKQPAHCDVDSKAYIASAQMFYTKNSFADIGYTPYYTLGYPLFMGTIYKSQANDNITLIIIAQIALSILIGLIIFFFTKHLFGSTAAACSSFFFSWNLGYLIFSQFILTEIVLAFFLLLGLYIFYRARQSTHLIGFIGAGLIFGISVIIKPAALYYPLMLIICIPKPSLRSWLVAGTLLLSSFYLPIAIYQIHNKLTFSSWSIGSLDDVNLLFWFLPHVLAEKNGTSSDHERITLKHLEATHGTSHIRSLLWKECTKNPSAIIYAWLKNTVKTFGGLYTANLRILVDPSAYSGQYSFFRMHGSYFQRSKAYVWDSSSLLWVRLIGIGELCWNIIRLFFVIIALCYLLLTRQWFYLFLFVSYLAYFLFITGHDGCARFRMMIEAPLLILAAQGCSLLIRRQQS